MARLASPPAPSSLAPYVTVPATASWDCLADAERRALLIGLLSLGTLEGVEFDDRFDLVHIVALAPSGRRYEGVLDVADLPTPTLA